MTIKELFEKTKTGEIDPAALIITVDNDETFFCSADPDTGDERRIDVPEANGHYDVMKLYRLLFPGATVEKC